MTGPASGGLERGTGAPTRSTGTQGAVSAILIVLALGLALRVIIAYLLPGSGFDTDLSSFRAWAANLFDEGLYGFYERDFFHDYTPGYLYVLWLVGAVGSALGGVGDLIKIPPILTDLGIAWLVWSMVRELGGRDRLALLAAIVVVVNPVFWFDSVVWGQVDSFGVLFLLLALRELWRDHPERAAILTLIAALIKPQLGILVPHVAVVTIRRALWPIVTGATPTVVRDDVGWLGRIRAWEARTDSPWRILTTGAAGYLTAVVLCLPFGLSVLVPQAEAPFFSSGLIEQIVLAGGGYPYLTVNAYNAWALVPGDLGNSLANSGLWMCDSLMVDASRCTSGTTTFGPIPAVAVGAALLLATIVGVLAVAARRPDRLTLLVALSVLAIAFFAAPTRVHERYGFPFFALGAILFAISFRWRIAYVVMSVATFLNMYVVLTTLYPPGDPTTNPVVDWLGIGEAIRSPAGIVTVAIMHTAVFVWALIQLRAAGRERLAADLAAAGPLPDLDPSLRAPADPSDHPRADAPVPVAASTQRPGAGPAVAVATITYPSWTEPRSFSEAGFTGWFRDRLRARPARADRSAALAREGGGRLDRLDVWFLAILLLATLGMRTFRLAEPYQMHFDEVYHARTAAEFLQGWRYGLDHDIYEWTHPHLAKYAMAGGLVLWGEDDVRATSALGTPVRAAAIEHRREDAVTGERAGERVHVATGSEIRTYDLRSRELVAVVPAPGASAVAVDPIAELLVVGSDDGDVSTIDLASIGLEEGLTPLVLARLDHPVAHLLVTDDGAAILAASDARLTSLDAAEGTVRGTVDLAGIADLAPGGTGDVLVAVPAAIDDQAAIAATLVELLGGDEREYLDLLEGATDPDGQVVMGSPGSGEERTAVDEAITDGRLAGLEVVELPRVAVATEDGVTFIDPATTGVSSEIAMEGGAHGLAMVTGLDDPKLYVTSGPFEDPGYETVVVGGDKAADGPTRDKRGPLPAPGTRVAYDEATQQVHILGLVPGATGSATDDWTVYVVEPHGDPGSVFADAALPDGMIPSAWVMDVEAAYVADDRQELLVFGDDGATASIALGSHAFAWRLPGVIAGALMAACLYLLTRILFRRRLVAGLVAAFVALDGMLFVQSRIGMNDVYVGLFIMAAYTVFAAVWTGWWRGRAAFWISMPVIGLLMGLALASKWVAAYAIGALVLLLLVRSALGRVVAILGLIAITSLLGYIALAVPEGQGIGNVTFLVVMVALTLLAVVVAVHHPVAWTDEEQWLALLAPAAAGALVFFGALAMGRLDATITVGSLAVTPLQVAFLLATGSILVAVAFWVGGRIGYGPLATPPGPDDPRIVLESPAPPPSGWLRPGWLLGLPLVWATISLVAIPLVVYVISYIPWAMIDGHQLWTGVPAGHDGQTLLELTAQMYGYHNGLTAPHPASSPWWAWPFDLKPVWFYQDSFAGATTAAIYDAGNLVIWWLGVPAMAFVSIMAFRRRSLALALIAIGFAAQWIPWARIDRAAFQYHYYTALPFVVMALAYFVAELWNGATRRTWMWARIAAGVAIVGPALMWVLSRPLCAFVGVETVNPGSAACPAVIPDFVLTVRTLGLLLVVAVGAVVLGRGVLALQHEAEEGGEATAGSFRGLIVAALGVAIGFAAAALLPETALLTLSSVPVEPIAVVIGLPLAYFGAQVVAARDARRYVAGLMVAVVAWFAVVYPNISALPLPSVVANAYQGLLPTYLYAFQFPVSTADRNLPSPLLSPTLAILAIAIAVTCLVVAYSAAAWRLALAESRAATGSGSASGDPADGLARSGGGA